LQSNVISKVGLHLSQLIRRLLILDPFKSFQGHHGRAWLFDKVVNVMAGPQQERVMTTGPHVVRDILCKGCTCILGEWPGDVEEIARVCFAHARSLAGWQYVHAYEISQRYKEGKYIMERNLLCEAS
jgi:hypothetical protein